MTVIDQRAQFSARIFRRVPTVPSFPSLLRSLAFRFISDFLSLLLALLHVIESRGFRYNYSKYVSVFSYYTLVESAYQKGSDVIVHRKFV